MKERDCNAVDVLIKRTILSLSIQKYIKQYREFLTPYAFKFVKTEIHKMKYIKVASNVNETFETKSKFCNRTVTFTSCTCVDFNSMKLPCLHILKIRQYGDESLFHEGLCSQR